MNRYKRFCLSLCFLLACCVGFLSIDNLKVHAYTKTENFYPLVEENSILHFYINDWNTVKTYNGTYKDNRIVYSNPDLSNVFGILWVSNSNSSHDLVFPYNPEVYDYYILGNLVTLNTDTSKSTFKPRTLNIYGWDYATNTNEYYPLNNLHFYDIDTSQYCGFGWYARIDFGSRDNIGIKQIGFYDDKDGLGNKPANLTMEMGILAVDKTASETVVLSQILQQLQNMESSITENIQNSSNAISSAVGQAGEKVTGAIDSAKDELKDKINEQYEMDENEDFGVGTITEQVEEKLGVLTVGTGTLVGFLDLFNSGNAGSTEIVFPAFEITVQGETYPVWNDISYDLRTLEDDFGILINAVRTILVLCVWMAVLSYLVKAKDHVINNRG